MLVGKTCVMVLKVKSAQLKFDLSIAIEEIEQLSVEPLLICEAVIEAVPLVPKFTVKF